MNEHLWFIHKYQIEFENEDSYVETENEQNKWIQTRSPRSPLCPGGPWDPGSP